MERTNRQSAAAGVDAPAASRPAPVELDHERHGLEPGMATRRTNGLAIAALVCGLVGGPGVGSVLALSFGFRARRQIATTGEAGRGMATAGIILGFIGILILMLLVGLVVVVNVKSVP